MAKSYDDVLSKIMDEHKDVGLGWEWKFADTLLSFVRRNTKLLETQQSTKKFQTRVSQHAELLEKARKKKESPQESPQDAKAKIESDNQPKKPKKDEPKVVELKDDEPEAEPQSQPKPKAAAADEPKEKSKSKSKPKAAADADEPKENKKSPEEAAEDSGPALVGNGGTTDKYTWVQTLRDLTMYIDIPVGLKSSNIKVDFGPESLKVVLKKDKYLDGKLWRKVNHKNCTWTLDELKPGKSTRTLQIDLEKVNQMEWWDCVLEGDPKIDAKKISPENSKLEDLDSDTRQTVEKMMFDQRARAAGLPGSAEIEKRAALDRFMAAHPEMDFSKAKVSYN